MNFDDWRFLIVLNRMKRAERDGRMEEAEKEILFRQIGAKIAYYRTLRGLTQEQLASRINVNKSTIGRIERGKYNHNISVSILMDIAEGLHVDLALFFTFSEQEKKMWWELEQVMEGG